MHPSVCTLDDAARDLQLHTNTVSLWVRDGRLPGAKIGRSYRLWRPAIFAHIQAQPYRLRAADDPWLNRELISTTECAQALDLTPQTILNLIGADQMPAQRLGRYWRIPWPELRLQLITPAAE